MLFQVKKAFFALVANGVRAAPLWESKKQSFVGKTERDVTDESTHVTHAPTVTIAMKDPPPNQASVTPERHQSLSVFQEC